MRPRSKFSARRIQSTALFSRPAEFLEKVESRIVRKKAHFSMWFAVPTSDIAKFQSRVDTERERGQEGAGLCDWVLLLLAICTQHTELSTGHSVMD